MSAEDGNVEDGKKKIREHAYYMKKALDAADMKEALKSAEQMISSLRVDKISPKDYYMFFMLVFDELNILELAFRELYNKKKIKFSKIYEKVQYSHEIIPRLYLMITAGSVLIDTKEMTSSAVIQDLFQMLKGVQHPFRGLFVRYYFLKMIKTKIPDAEEEGYQEKLEREFGCLENILDMLLENLGEMNKLWIRIGSLIKDKKRRKQERGDLKITVGENIVRLASIQGLTVEAYKEKLLPTLLEHVSLSNSRLYLQAIRYHNSI
jgi:vacuolar protein sorting-associated protein 35